MSKKQVAVAPPRQGPGAVLGAAACLAGSALIHAAVLRAHLLEWRLAGLFFLALAMVEAYLAVGLVRWPELRGLYVVTIAVNLGTAAVWLLSRTAGLPFGPEAFHAEPIGALDTLSTALELGACVLVAPLTTRLSGTRRAALESTDADPLDRPARGERHRSGHRRPRDDARTV